MLFLARTATICLFVAHTSALLADTPPELPQLFAAGLKNTPPAVEAARKHAVECKRRNLDDLRIDYAYGLVLANQRRYADAQRLLVRYAKSRPNDVAAQRVKLWTEIEGKQYDAALSSIATIGRLLTAPPAGSPSPDQVATAKYLGTCFAFLELVEPNDIDQQAVSARKDSIVGQLDDECLRAFDEGRTVVTEQLAAIEAARDARLKRAEEANAERAKQIAADLNVSLEKVSSRRETIQSSAEKAQESQRELRVIQQQLSSLAPDRVRVSAQIITLQACPKRRQNPSWYSTTQRSQKHVGF